MNTNLTNQPVTQASKEATPTFDINDVSYYNFFSEKGRELINTYTNSREKLAEMRELIDDLLQEREL